MTFRIIRVSHKTALEREGVVQSTGPAHVEEKGKTAMKEEQLREQANSARRKIQAILQDCREKRRMRPKDVREIRRLKKIAARSPLPGVKPPDLITKLASAPGNGVDEWREHE